MSGINEATPVGMMGPNLAGLTTLSSNAVIPFTRYIRYVLPLDGYVFWLKAQATTVQGSVHVTADKRQNEDETIAVNRVLFTTGEDVQVFNVIEPDQIWVGETAGVKFAFSRSGPRYKQSGLFHYVGDAVYPPMLSQLVDVGSELSPDTLIVSNSLPAWLTLRHYDPVWLQIPNPCVTLYPSFLVPDNIPPPYGVVHIEPSQTQPLQAVSALGRITTSQHQLSSDRVRLTLYGLTNEKALAFVGLVNQYSRDTNMLGMMEPVTVHDEKRTQAELGIIAMKKTVNYTVSYYQGALRNVARQLIKQATLTVLPQPGVI